MDKFRVLIVDDKEIVLETLKNNIKTKFNAGVDRYDIELLLLHVNVIGDDTKEEYQISDTTIKQLIEYSKEPFDLILLDFGFRMSDSNIIDRIVKRYGNQLNLKSLDGKLLNPNDLVKETIEYARKKMGRTSFNNLNANLINHKNKIILYTYTPPSLKYFFPSSQLRESITTGLFPQASEINVIDTRALFFNDEQFVNKYDEKFYSYMVSVYLQKIIDCEMWESLLKKAKYIKISKTTKSVGLIVLFAGIYGAITEFLVDIIINLFNSNLYIVASIIILLVVISVVIGGKLVINVFEGRFKDLFHSD